MPAYPGFIGAFDTSLSQTADCEDTMNWYLEQLPTHAKNQAALYPTPGQTSFCATTDVGTTGLCFANGREFGIVGIHLNEIFADGSYTQRGTVASDINPATISYNGIAGSQLFITSGGNGYCFDLITNTLTLELSGGYTMGGTLDGYFIAFKKNQYQLSNLNDGTTWDPTQFLQRSTAPDPWVAMVVVQQPAGIWLIGEQTGEVHYDTGGFPFPFAPVPGASFRYGTPAPFSVSVGGDQVRWLSQTPEGAGIIVAARGYVPGRISSSPVETAIETYARTTTINDCESFTYSYQGHLFSIFSFPSANATHVYDSLTGVWHRRGKWNSPLMRYDMWDPRCHSYAFGQHIVGNRMTGIIAELDPTKGTELDGTAIRRHRVAPSLFHLNMQIAIRSLEIYLEAGLGTLTGQGSDPHCMLQTSTDSGKTYLPERTGSVGKMGDYKRRVRFNRFGVPRDFVPKLSVSDPIPWRLIDCFVNNDQGTSQQGGR